MAWPKNGEPNMLGEPARLSEKLILSNDLQLLVRTTITPLILTKASSEHITTVNFTIDGPFKEV